MDLPGFVDAVKTFFALVFSALHQPFPVSVSLFLASHPAVVCQAAPACFISPASVMLTENHQRFHVPGLQHLHVCLPVSAHLQPFYSLCKGRQAQVVIFQTRPLIKHRCCTSTVGLGLLLPLSFTKKHTYNTLDISYSRL